MSALDENEVLRRMLATKPQPHKPSAPKPPDDRASEGKQKPSGEAS